MCGEIADVNKSGVLPILIGALLSLCAGYLVLEIVVLSIEFTWITVPEQLGTAPWYVLLVLVTAAIAVYVIRTYLGDTGHSPLGGIKVHALTPREYLSAILAIFASLVGGAVLGPEVALVSTGAVIGGLVAKAFTVDDPKRVVSASAGGAILALFVNPLLNGSLSLNDAPKSVEVDQLLWAVVVALVAALLTALARYGATRINQLTGNKPHLPALVITAVVIGSLAIALNMWTDLSYAYIATSSEELLTELPTLTSVSAVVGIVVMKTIAYSLSMGSGFRGGPFFPIMFIGAATGLLFSLIIPSGPQVAAAIAVGLIASVIATAPMKWPIAIVLGIALGYLMGGWALVPAAVIGAIVARAVPRFGQGVKAEIPS
jgi:H+/Cl- antiporter ClcA